MARLEARVARLEELLAARSRSLQEIVEGLCLDDLLNLSRRTSGLPVVERKPFGLSDWRETTALSSEDVDATMKQLWQSPEQTPGAPE
ncbi:MAG TPA: hypothetical protein VL084_08700 [Thermoanaerobaculia bacterium]|nr:hypothetical protein [Thermoanaerobaculia bacterium]